MKKSEKDIIIEKNVKLSEDNPEPLELVASHIEKLSEGIKKLRAGRVSERVIILLLADITKLPHGEIKRCLDGAEMLASYFIKKTPKS